MGTGQGLEAFSWHVRRCGPLQKCWLLFPSYVGVASLERAFLRGSHCLLPPSIPMLFQGHPQEGRACRQFLLWAGAALTHLGSTCGHTVSHSETLPQVWPQFTHRYFPKQTHNTYYPGQDSPLPLSLSEQGHLEESQPQDPEAFTNDTSPGLRDPRPNPWEER